jgi:transcriptional regulator of acetoin/glycerol metabolism
MEYLFEQVRHSESMVILADNRGTLMHTLGDTDFLRQGGAGRAEHLVRPGASSIVAPTPSVRRSAEEARVEMHGAEHFLERNGFPDLRCCTDHVGSTVASCWASSTYLATSATGIRMTLGLVSTAARMIENRF